MDLENAGRTRHDTISKGLEASVYPQREGRRQKMDLATVVLFTVVRCTAGGMGMEYQVFPMPSCKEFEKENGALFVREESEYWPHGYSMCFPVPKRFTALKSLLHLKDHDWGKNCPQ